MHIIRHAPPRLLPLDLPADRRGPHVFGLLGVSDVRQVGSDEMDALAAALAEHLQ